MYLSLHIWANYWRGNSAKKLGFQRWQVVWLRRHRELDARHARLQQLHGQGRYTSTCNSLIHILVPFTFIFMLLMRLSFLWCPSCSYIIFIECPFVGGQRRSSRDFVFTHMHIYICILDSVIFIHILDAVICMHILGAVMLMYFLYYADIASLMLDMSGFNNCTVRDATPLYAIVLSM